MTQRFPSLPRWPQTTERVRARADARTARAMATDMQASPPQLAAAAAFAPDPAGYWALLPPLPASVALQIYNLLTVEERLRAREVSRAWRHVPGGWRCVDLCMTGWRPQHCQRVLGLVTKHVAASSVQSLRVEFPDTLLPTDISEFRDALTGSVNAHSATLRTLDVTFPSMGLSLLDTILGRCPALESCRVGELQFELGALADVLQLAAVLKGDGRYSRVVVCALEIEPCGYDDEFHADLQLCEAVQGHRSLRKLTLHAFISSGATGVLARAAARAGVVDFKFACDNVDDEETFTREVAQLLDGFPVQCLCLEFRLAAQFAYDRLFVMALRNHRTLQTLAFEYADFEGANTDIFRALVGHPTLNHLRLASPRWQGQHLFESLADILAASSALTQLSLENAHWLDEDDIRITIAGLDSPDARLQKLMLFTDMAEPFSASFAARVIGPAVLNCASMRELRISGKGDGDLYDVQCRINDLLRFNDEDD